MVAADDSFDVIGLEKVVCSQCDRLVIDINAKKYLTLARALRTQIAPTVSQKLRQWDYVSVYSMTIIQKITCGVRTVCTWFV